MLPPPAPTVWMSSCGRRSGRPPTRRSALRPATPSRIRQTSVDVPPMSKLIASGMPAATTAATPPAGPDRSSRAGCAAASSRSHTPPFDCITAGAGRPSAAAVSASRRR